MIQKAHKYLSEIELYKPGISSLSGIKKILKLSSNENSLKTSKKAVVAYLKCKAKLFRYPDGSCLELTKALSKKYKIDEEKIVCGAGSDELIGLITSAFAGVGDEIIFSKHGFLMYAISAKRVGAIAKIADEKIENNFIKSDVSEILKLVSKKTKIIFIANPNNPTGSYLNRDELKKLLDNISKEIIVVLDCAYQEFVVEKDYPCGIDAVNNYENIILTRTFSKIYGLAALRVGWSYSNKYVAEILHKIRGPFNVSMPAQMAAIAALRDDKFFEKSKKNNSESQEFFKKELKNFKTIKFFDTVANFILLDFGSAKNSDKANKYLLKNGIILREMSAYNLPNCLRLTFGNKKENKFVIKILKKFDNV